jgi:prevent-host-death family protein
MRLGRREANQHFARAITAVRSGQELVLTDRGRPIAVIKAIKDDDGSQAVALRAMTAEGVITLPDPKGQVTLICCGEPWTHCNGLPSPPTSSSAAS